eukprot:1650280-Pleurochrysis_carterae.AAC.1
MNSAPHLKDGRPDLEKCSFRCKLHRSESKRSKQRIGSSRDMRLPSLPAQCSTLDAAGGLMKRPGSCVLAARLDKLFTSNVQSSCMTGQLELERYSEPKVCPQGGLSASVEHTRESFKASQALPIATEVLMTQSKVWTP